MHHRHTLLAAAIAALFTPALIPAALAQDTAGDNTLPTVTVTASPFAGADNAQILTPAKVLAGHELRDKLDSSLGATLSHELGVSTSGFGAGASRPIIRGLEGPRVKILQNGMAVSDVSGISNDHAVGAEASTARQIEILRGPAALLYGSGAIGGLVNVVNERIPVELATTPRGEAEVRFGSVNREKSSSFSADGAAGQIGLHLDGNLRDSGDYRIPGNAGLNDPGSSSGTLPSSFSRASSLGLGAAAIGTWGHLGASVGTNQSRYGIPTAERSFIKLAQDRLDLDGLFNAPLPGIETMRIKLGYTDYRHTEFLQDGSAATNFKNRALESRLELTHLPLSGWRGRFGLQTEDSKFSALAADGSGPETVPVTKSTSIAAFVVEERDFGPLRASAGARLETARRRPEAASGLPERQFTLGSYSLGALWTFTQGYAVGSSVSFAQRAPSTEELYSKGPHESTATFDIGDANLKKERSRNIELSLQKTEGLMRWKANLFQNHIDNFIYGHSDGSQVDSSGMPEAGGEFRQRNWTAGQVVLRGAEAEISYNLKGEGWSVRSYADTSRGVLQQGGNLPLQPATRYGVDVGYKAGAWRSGMALLHARTQNRLASFETAATPAYSQLDANISYTTLYRKQQVTWFALAKNLLNQDIRLSTSLLKDIAPLPGRNLILGVRSTF